MRSGQRGCRLHKDARDRRSAPLSFMPHRRTSPQQRRQVMQAVLMARAGSGLRSVAGAMRLVATALAGHDLVLVRLADAINEGRNGANDQRGGYEDEEG